MRQLEKQQADQWTGTRNTRKEFHLSAPPSPADGRKRWPGHSVEEIEVAWAPLLNFLGYQLQTRALDSNAVPVWVRTGQPL